MIWKTYIRQHPRFGPWYTRVERQPSWVIKFTAIAAVLVIVVPLVLLTFAALLVAAVVFTFLALVMRGLAVLGSIFNFSNPDDAPTYRGDGRENVRVIQRP